MAYVFQGSFKSFNMLARAGGGQSREQGDQQGDESGGAGTLALSGTMAVSWTSLEKVKI